MGPSEGWVQICSGRVERRGGVIARVRWSAVVLMCPHTSTTLVVASGLADFSGDLHSVINRVPSAGRATLPISFHVSRS